MKSLKTKRRKTRGRQPFRYAKFVDNIVGDFANAPRVTVWWNDAFTHVGWFAKADLPIVGLVTAKTTGYLVRSNADETLIALTVASHDAAGDGLSIPTPQIYHAEVLRGTPIPIRQLASLAKLNARSIDTPGG